MNRKSLTLLAAASAVLLTATAVVGQSPSGPAEPRLKIGFVIHVKGNSNNQLVIAAAQKAADDLGVDLLPAGPEGFDAEAQLKYVQDLFAAGADGVATSIPGETMSAPLNQLIADGHPIVMFNIYSSTIDAPYVGENPIPAWSQIGALVGNAVGTDATGEVVLGTCAPQLDVLVQRGNGVVKGLAETSPGLIASGPFDVKVDPVVNYQLWQQLAAAHPDAKAFVGLCAPDPENLGKVNAENGDKWVMAGGDFTPGNIQAVIDGHVLASIGQASYVQGYLPVKMLVDHIRNGTPLDAGILSSGVEMLTKDGATFDYGLPAQTVDEAKAIFSNQEKSNAFYAPLFADGGPMDSANWPGLIIPFSEIGS